MKVERDEHGLFIDLQFGSAIRPAGFSSIAEGSDIDVRHFGGTPLYGAVKLPGRGNYQEAWLVGPLPRIQYEERQSRTWEPFLHIFHKELGLLLKANPEFDSLAQNLNIEKLKNAREKFMKSVGYSFGLLQIEKELIDLGKNQICSQLAFHEAQKIKSSIADPRARTPASKKPRV